MATIATLVLSLFLSAAAAHAEAEPHHDHTDATPAEAPGPDQQADASAFAAEPGQVVVQVNGMVCSFCAHGVEKALSKLEVVDSSQFGDGVFVDIGAHRVTLALRPGQAVPFGEIHRRIRKAGYDPVRFYVDVSGQAERAEGGWLVRGTAPPQVFTIASLPADPGELRFSAHLEAAVASELAPEAPVPVVFDALR